MNTQRDVNAYVPHDPADGTADGALERWEIAAGSRLTFTLRHLVLREIHGEFRRRGGTLFLSREQPALSRIEAWVDLASIATDSAERDAHGDEIDLAAEVRVVHLPYDRAKGD